MRHAAVQAGRPGAGHHHGLVRAAAGCASRHRLQVVEGVDRSRAQKPLSFSSGGSGSPGHLAVALFNEATGGNVQHVPYKGNTPAVTAVLSGEVEGGVLATPGMLPHVKAGKNTPLAVTSRQRAWRAGRANRRRTRRQ
ncbi:MAG: tripartite tricarboxylate transporter substrate-binding protein [Burkholderiales bacterium]